MGYIERLCGCGNCCEHYRGNRLSFIPLHRGLRRGFSPIVSGYGGSREMRDFNHVCVTQRDDTGAAVSRTATLRLAPPLFTLESYARFIYVRPKPVAP